MSLGFGSTEWGRGCLFKNKREKMFAVSENIAMFVVPNSENYTGSHATYESAIIKRSSLSDDSTPVGSRCLAKHKGDSASFVIHILQVFQTMPNSENLNANAQGASASTADTRNSVPYSVLKSQEKTYCILVIGHVSVQSRWFGHGCKEIVTAHSEHAAISKAINRYSRRSTALPIQAVIVLPDKCTISNTPDYVR